MRINTKQLVAIAYRSRETRFFSISHRSKSVAAVPFLLGG